jgi:uncharacterized protein
LNTIKRKTKSQNQSIRDELYLVGMISEETVLITGGTGLIGKAITSVLVDKGYNVIILSRKPKKSHHSQINYAVWDPANNKIDEAALKQATTIINLAGESVAEKRWTEKRKKEIVESRVSSGKTIVDALAAKPNHVYTVISASAIGWYGPDVPGKIPFKEDAPHSDNFLGNTCFAWENAIRPVTEMDKRLVIFRIGIVLDKSGGAYPQLTLPLKFRTLAWFGSGKQVTSWIHIEELAAMFLFAIEHKEMQGVYNAVATEPVTNKELIKEVAKCRKGIFIPMPIPAAALKLGLGEMSVEILKSATVSNEKILQSGFQYIYPTIADAIKNLEG